MDKTNGNLGRGGGREEVRWEKNNETHTHENTQTYVHVCINVAYFCIFLRRMNIFPAHVNISFYIEKRIQDSLKYQILVFTGLVCSYCNNTNLCSFTLTYLTFTLICSVQGY